MLDNSTGVAQVDWVVQGSHRGFQVSIPVESQITLNQLTGRISGHR